MEEKSENLVQDNEVQHNNLPDGVKEKVISLYNFVKELSKLKQKSIINIKDHNWFYDLSKLPNDPENITFNYKVSVEDEYETPDEETSEDVLLSVKKPKFEECPEPNSIFSQWLCSDWKDYRIDAEVREYWQDNYEETTLESERFDSNKARVEAYNNWLNLRNRWVEKQRIIGATFHLFSDLYKYYFELQRESETEEIIVACGILQDKRNFNLKHPVLTHRIKLKFDASQNIIYVVDTQTPTELYSILFTDMPDINKSSIAKLTEDLQNNDYHPLDKENSSMFLKALVNQLSSSSLYVEDKVPENRTERLLLSYSPCLIIRKRLDGTPKAIEKVIDTIEKTNQIPAPIIDIVNGGKYDLPQDKEESIEERLASVGGESIDVLLSKEANKEQLEIAKRIEAYNAVLVQGPPGTGKTHTIANLMGHFLAQGKSVLVTSYTSKALNVLKDKVAPGLQNLCVSVLDDSNADMEKSIDGITEYMANTTSSELHKEMLKLNEERNDIINKLADTRKKIYAIINQECNCIVYNGEDISPSAASQFIVENADKLSYIPGEIRSDCPLPLSFEELSDLYRSNELLTTDDETELSYNLPNPNDIISPAELSSLSKIHNTSLSQLELIKNQHNLNIQNNSNDKTITISSDIFKISLPYPNQETIESLNSYCDDFSNIEDWMKVVAVDGKKGGPIRQRWFTLIEQIEKLNKLKATIVGEQFGKKITYNNDIPTQNLQRSFEEIKKIIEKKGKITKSSLLFHKEYSEALESTLINDKKIATIEECDIILHDIQYRDEFQKCASYWNELFENHNAPKFEDLDAYNQEEIALRWIFYIKKYADWYANDYSILIDKLTDLGINSDDIFKSTPLDSDITITNKILNTISRTIPVICDICYSIIKDADYSVAINNAKSVLLSDQRGKSEICKALLNAIDNADLSNYAEKYSELEKLYNKYELQIRRNELLKKLEPIAPQWAQAIKNHGGIHGSFTVPSNIEDAWKWKQLNTIIDNITSTPFSQLQKDSIKLGKEYRIKTAEYAEKSGWYYLLLRTEANIDTKQALIGWKQTIKKIGKGTGKRAPMLKAKARELMSKCQNAVPAWIMPINRAIDSLNPAENKFDIIIVDEASQADLSSLALLYMGKKFIVVGDDKQVSPMAVGIEVDKITSYQEQYLNGKIPNPHLYTSQTSIYDIASTTFQPLMLREHFRCVPDIIGFSNMLSYDYKIKPLRDASSSNLLPAVVTYRVKDGKRSGKSNEKEAETIVALIKSCIKQPEYKDKTFGVISLLGSDQVKLIQNKIEKEITSIDIENHKILCGDSANFQGDERDVIFLSLVDSSENGPLRLQGMGVGDSSKKRYNVAVSRARDQLWVVYSLDPSNDLKPGDLRKILIDYALDPKAKEYANKIIESNSESPFESSVAKSLSDRGYHLVQQWKVGSYRLDMVAVYKEKKVAIECDGERWHSGEAKIRDDMERQAILERLGWRFIRIRGSEYYRNNEKTIEKVIEELNAFEIYPEDTSNTSSDEKYENELLRKIKFNVSEILHKKEEADTSKKSTAFNRESIPIYKPKFSSQQIQTDTTVKATTETTDLRSKQNEMAKNVIKINIGDKVFHHKWGNGTICEKSSSLIKVKFDSDNDNLRQFQYPNAFFQGFLKKL